MKTETPGTEEKLLAYVRGGRIHPALLFRGAKLEVAKKLAQVMLCRDPRPPSPFCGKCSACRRVQNGSHPDLLIYREEEEGQIKIDPIRALCHQMEIGPTEGGPKICIIDEFHRMNAAAENAMLKTLEEPGPNRYFWLLTTQPGLLLGTTRSRCIEYIFKPEPEVETPEVTAELVRLFDQAIESGQPSALVPAFEKDKERCLGFLKFLQTQLRAAAVGVATLPSFRKYSCEDALRIFDEALKLEGRLRSNANYGLMLETFMRREFLT